MIGCHIYTYIYMNSYIYQWTQLHHWTIWVSNGFINLPVKQWMRQWTHQLTNEGSDFWMNSFICQWIHCITYKFINMSMHSSIHEWKWCILCGALRVEMPPCHISRSSAKWHTAICTYIHTSLELPIQIRTFARTTNKLRQGNDLDKPIGQPTSHNWLVTWRSNNLDKIE